MEPTRHLTHVKKLLNAYQKEHNIKIRTMSAGTPILPKGHWDYLIKRFKCREESQQYSTKKLYIPETNTFITINEDVDPREGVMSRFDPNLIAPTPILSSAQDKIIRAPLTDQEDDVSFTREDWENAG